MSKSKKKTTEVKTEIEKNTLSVDPTITNEEVKKAEETKKSSIEAKKSNDDAEAKATTAMAGTQVNNKAVQNVVVVESNELKKAVKSDAEKRGKLYEVCPISGVLVVK